MNFVQQTHLLQVKYKLNNSKNGWQSNRKKEDLQKQFQTPQSKIIFKQSNRKNKSKLQNSTLTCYRATAPKTHQPYNTYR